jgi:hypothetical protein
MSIGSYHISVRVCQLRVTRLGEDIEAMTNYPPGGLEASTAPCDASAGSHRRRCDPNPPPFANEPLTDLGLQKVSVLFLGDLPPTTKVDAIDLVLFRSVADART